KERFIAKTKLVVNFYNLIFRNLAELTPLKEEEVIEQVWQYAKTITALAVDGTEFINDYIRLGKKVLAEGAQGVHLDIDFGTYPYVTSSNPSPGGICTGLGISPKAITRLIGVVKAYTTRVGEGPLPTELTEEAGETLRRLGSEYGATTGRPRRCGWLDIPLLRRSLQLTGINEIALTKLDVLDTFPLIKICTAYKYNTKEVDILPYGVERNEDVKPIYEVLPGWAEPTQDITEYDKIPENARKYLEYIERLLKVQVILISVGPQRRRAIIRERNIWRE
ncbi:MAG: adenylosuccinate synthetase, partial [Candidatus Sumerlaeia bacterium]|nr:adenylosuccinate synthetase [Candidatus Sumerlaeia bacterium]